MGPILILLARHIDMPSSWVGLLIAFMPLSMVLVLITIPLVERLGSKRLMMVTWLLRNLIACSVFAMPWAMAQWGTRTAWYVLLSATLGFCLVRAMGVGAWFPWLHEMVPEKERGTFFSAETSVVQSVTVAVILGQAFVLQGNPGVWRYLAIYGAGIGAGLASLVWMRRVPGGGRPRKLASTRGSIASYKEALADRRFVSFVLVASLCFSSVSWLSASLVLYLRDALGLLSSEIMAFMAVGSASILLTVRFWARFADHSGSGRAMFKTLTAHAIAALACLALVPGARWTIYAALPLIAVVSTFGGAFWTVTYGAMLDYVKASNRVGYTNIWMVASALAMGVTPILAGQVIERWGIWGFRTCFLISGAAGLCCAIACRLVVWDGGPHERPALQLLSQAQPLRTLARIAWITVGMHRSNRPAGSNSRDPS